ncbi:MAG TPA: outer membrane protein assembly factor BamD [Gemmatimonadales bacterium]|nr:outer membrane protein assembly factor BamD [Gemmatimonadales bacterium]
MHRCLLPLLALAACRPAPAATRAAPDPGVVLAEARSQFRHGKFAKALLSLQRLKFELQPGDSAQAEVAYDMAECEFQTGDLPQAAHDFRAVSEGYPNSQYAPLALLREGDANLRQWKVPELDPAAGDAALAIYQELAERYPGTDAAARGQIHARELREQFAEKEYKNGMFYFRRHAWDSAIIYFKSVIATYPETTWVPQALLRLVDSYRAIGYTEERVEACAHLHQYFPTTPGLADRCPADTAAAPPS